MIPSRRARHLGLALAAILAAACQAPWSPPPAPRARLVLSRPPTVRVNDPVTVLFDQSVDGARLQLQIRPDIAISVKRPPDRLVITPVGGWRPGERYTVQVRNMSRADHRSTAPVWKASFATQSRLAVGYLLDGQPVSGAVRFASRSRLQLAFPAPMRPESVRLTVDGRDLPASNLGWASDGTSVMVSPAGLLPYRTASLVLRPGALTASGDPLTDMSPLQVTLQATLPANGVTGVGPGFKPRAPVEIVVENSGAARPQAGLQAADLVYEYLSEYQVSRMTAIYFNHVPDLVGPVRSCRMVNPYLGFAYAGVTMCSGGSVGTLHWMFGSPDEGRLVPSQMEPFDKGDHYFRSANRAQPHNLYTSGDRAERLRAESPALAAGDYAVDPPHGDVQAGEPAEAPTVPLHSASYTYDGATGQYLRSDHGTAFYDEQSGDQLRVKNVVLLHVPFRDAGWIEDETGGAHSIWYDLLGSGPAQIYSGGRLVNATWHMGSAPGQWYYDNQTPVWFTDQAGNLILLNTGLTWMHVLGDGQTG